MHIHTYIQIHTEGDGNTMCGTIARSGMYSLPTLRQHQLHYLWNYKPYSSDLPLPSIGYHSQMCTSTACTYTCTYTQPPKISRGERHRAADAVAGGRGADGVRPGPPRGRPASPPTTAGPHRRGGRLLPSGLPTVTQSSGPSLPRTYTVRTAR